MKHLFSAIASWSLLLGSLAIDAAIAREPTQDSETFFERRVRPVFAERCWSCHGPEKQKGGLRLDTAEGLKKGSDNGPVVVAGDPENSPLIQAIRQTGTTKMPPKGRLPSAEIEALATWVKHGAVWPGTLAAGASTAAAAGKTHWAFQPMRRATPPSVPQNQWTRTPVDRWILAALEAKGLAPSAAADRRTLLRRVTYDLLGLPPTPAEIAAFEADPSPDAWSHVVDRLLASPHYGERWGRYWLDVARYADTKGYVFFEENAYPWAYTYRDYVIRSFNTDLPYDQFVLQQLAADQLPLGADRRPLTALGFLTVGGRFMNNRHDILDDRIDVVSRGLLGLTVGCARCHDHKYDPIPSADYYSLYGVFASCKEPTVPPVFAEPPHTAAYESYVKELATRERKLSDFVRKKHEELVSGARLRAAEYLLAAQAMRNHPKTDDFMLIADGKDLNPKMLLRWQVYLERTARGHHPVWSLWHQLATVPEKELASRIDTFLRESASAVRPINRRILEAFRARPPRTLAEVSNRYAEVLNGADREWQLALEQARAAKRPLPVALPDPAAEELRQVYYGPDSPPNLAMNPVGDLDLLPDRPSQETLQKLRKDVETWRATGPGAPPRAMVVEDLPTPFEPYVFIRGNPHNRGPAVPRQFLGVLAGARRQPFTHGSGRLDLAQAIVAPDNPLTARVIVNRIWMHHFGAGLVTTPSDFGLRSDPPSHPELLDYLATYLVDHGWSIKRLHRLILLSAAYQQTSADRPEGQRLDPENRLLWRMNRQRLDFEALRDSLLAVAGKLQPTIGGPPMPELTAAPTSLRRTLYGSIDRLNLPGLFRTFDFPSPDSSSPRRDATTVAPQALFLMNHPFVQQLADQLLMRPEIKPLLTRSEKIRALYRLIYGRVPTEIELNLGEKYLEVEHNAPAGWSRYAQALLMANEFAFVD